MLFQLIFFSVFLHTSPMEDTQPIRVVRYQVLQKEIQNQSDTTYILNFFASWCAPCLKEIPELVKYANTHRNEKIKLLFLSLDLKKEYEKVLPPIIEKYGITQPVYLLDEPTSGAWMKEVDSTWTGSIPATLFLRKQYKKIIETPVNKDILEKYTEKSKHAK